MNNALQSTIIRYGAIQGLVGLLIFVGGATTGMMDFSSIMSSITFGLLSILISIGIIVYAVRQYRNEQNNTLTFNDGFVVALGISFLGIIIGTLGQYIYTNFIDPSFYESMADQMTEMFEKYNTPQSEVEKAVEQIKNSGTINAMLMSVLKSSAFMAIVSAIIAAIMKKQPENPFNNNTIDQL